MSDISSKYWKGLEEYSREESFEKRKHDEFGEKLPLNEEDLNLRSNRRDFLKFMGFGISAATIAACNRTPIRDAIPYIIKPQDVDPGVANWYASTCYVNNEAQGILVKTREGRPIKIEGNPDHPLTKGGSSAMAQASVLSVYDSGRMKGPHIDKQPTDWKTVDKDIKAQLEKIASENGAIRILSGTVISPTTKKVINDFAQKYKGTKHVTFDPVSSYAMLAANKKSFDKYLIPDYKFDAAKVIVGFNADFLGTLIAPVEYTEKYVAGRKVDRLKDMSFHMQFESTLSLTGSNADHRVPLKPSKEGLALLSLYNALAEKSGDVKYAASKFELAGNAVSMAAKKLWENKGKSIVISGTNDIGIQLIVNKINSLLGNIGKTITFDNASLQKQGNDEEMANLVKEMKAGKVGALIIYGSNPVYNYFDGPSFQEGLGKVKLTVSFNDRFDETTDKVTYACPNHHYLESWNDAQPKIGIYSLAQPSISPIFDTRAAQQSLMTWAGIEGTYLDYLKKYWKENIFPQQSKFIDFTQFWNRSLCDGIFVPSKRTNSSSAGNQDDSLFSGGLFTEFNASDSVSNISSNDVAGSFVNKKVNIDDEVKRLVAEANKENKVELVLYQKVGIQEGQDANNPWLQEMPDPISKVSWDNYICISPKLANELNYEQEDLVKISDGKNEIELPVLILPGQPYGTIGVALGYGRFYDEKYGKVAYKRGKNAYPFVTSRNNVISYVNNNVNLSGPGYSYQLALTQTHHNMEGREENTVREFPLNHFLEHPHDVKKHSHRLVSLYKDYNYGKGHHWAMAVDLNACTGCNACVISCQAENNVPVVGKEEVRRRREMHWIRIDRYFSIPDGKDDGDFLTKESEIDKLKDTNNLDKFDHVKVNFQPVMCQQCDNAPCENVCPVAAISHSNEGLNQQIYNRCVGTRYCENNCPYKVRRFNWFNYANNDRFDYNMDNDLGKMVLNPDVMVRSRGVMEKCSFCVQRIQLAKLDAKKKGERVKDGAIKTACQTACPANAIVFGDLNDPESEVHKLVLKNERSYTILTELDTKPSVNYMVKLRNEVKKEV